MTAVQLLGGASIRCDGAPVTGPAAQRHRLALLALVIAAHPRALGRDRAMALLWPEAEPERARRLLNLAVHVLRRAIGERAIVSAGDGLLYEPSAAPSDLHAFRSALESGRTEDAAEAYAGPFLDGFHLPDAPEFHYWLDERRAELSHAYEGALLQVAERQKGGGDMRGLVGTRRRLAAADPYSGSHARELMRALAAAGDRAGALRHAREHALRLSTDLELEPDAETAALAQQLQAPAEPAAAPAGIGASPVIAVLSDGSTDEGSADADVGADVRDRMVELLLRSAGLRVAAVGGGVHRVAASAPERPRADAVLETRVTTNGDRVTLRLRMVSSADGLFLLSTRLEQPAGALGELAEQAAAAVADALLVRPPVTRPGVSEYDREEARILCAKGEHFCARREESALRRAIECFEQARALAPDYSPAYTGLAGAYAILGFYDLLPPREAFGLAKHAAETARALNPADPNCHASLGYIAKYFEWHWGTAERELENAVALDPANPLAHQWFGNYHMLRGRSHEAIASMKRAMQLAPHSGIATAATGWAHYLSGMHELALEYFRDAAELDPQLPQAQLWRGQALEELGRHDEAVAALRAAAALSPTSAAVDAALARAIARSGDHDDAREMLRRLARRRTRDYVAPYEVGKVHLAMGDRAKALHCLEAAYRDRSHSMGFLLVDPQLAALRDDARFTRLARRVGHR